MSALTEATPAQRHALVAQRFIEIAQEVTNWDAPTPVKEWTAQDVIPHLSWLPSMLAEWGVTLEVAPADDPIQQFVNQTAAVQDLLESPAADQLIETPWKGSLPLHTALDMFYIFDVFAHGWDLAKASGQDPQLDADYATGVYHGMLAQGPALHATGFFGTPQPVAEDAPITDKLVALLGRDPAWAPTSP